MTKSTPLQTLAVAMATASAFERATGYYYNTADDGGMGAHYGYQMPLVAAPYHDNGHDDAGLVYAPYHVSRTRRAAAPQGYHSLSDVVNEIVRIELDFKRGLKSLLFPRGR